MLLRNDLWAWAAAAVLDSTERFYVFHLLFKGLKGWVMAVYLQCSAMSRVFSSLVYAKIFNSQNINRYLKLGVKGFNAGPVAAPGIGDFKNRYEL